MNSQTEAISRLRLSRLVEEDVEEAIFRELVAVENMPLRRR
jgi:hypothetical protein